MLRDLYVRNLAVMAEASVELGPGLNVLTGETGAGKSIVVDSLALLAGARASTDLIRTGAETLSVSGVFEPTGDGWREALREAGLDADGDRLVIRREVSSTGPNRVFVDDQPVTLRLLAQLAPHLMQIHGQRDEVALSDADEQRAWLDLAGGTEGGPLLARVAIAYQQWRTLASRLEEATGDEAARLRRIEELRFQVTDIAGAGLVPGEEDALREEREVLRHAEAILHGLDQARNALSEEEGAAIERLAAAREALAGVARWDAGVATWLEEIDELAVRTTDLAVTVSRRLDEIEADPRRLEEVEERLARLERLFRRFGGSSAELLERCIGWQEELDQLEEDSADREGLTQRTGAALAAFQSAAAELSAARRAWGDRLSANVQRELGDLALPEATFVVALGHRSRRHSPLSIDGVGVDLGPWGIDQVSFEISLNPGETPRPLSKIASGGELARIYLALRLAVRGEGVAPEAVLVFDEVDAGVGGKEAAALGRKLKRMARGGQVLAVTHLPQVASHADRHLRVAKEVRNERTYVAVEKLDDDNRVEEIARMLAGQQVTEVSRSHARELVAAGRATA